MYSQNFVIIVFFFLSSRMISSTPLVQDNEIFDNDSHLCGFPRKIPPSYTQHEFKDIYEFNWMVRINEKLKNSSDDSIESHPLFDGILIHPQIVLTNARLLENLKKKPVTVKISQIQLSWTGFGLEEFHEESRDVIEMIFHPQYDQCSLKNDVALLILSRPFELTKNVNTLCLPERNPALEMNLHCQEVPFSLHYKPLEKHCSNLVVTSRETVTTNEFLMHDEYSINFHSDKASRNETNNVYLRVETSHFFCKVDGRPPYFYGGMKTRLHSKSTTTFIRYYVTDIVTNYLKWIKTIMTDRLSSLHGKN